MKEFKIKLTDKTHKILKEYAKRDDRSMQKYMYLWMTYIATRPYKPAPTPSYEPKMEELMTKGEDE